MPSGSGRVSPSQLSPVARLWQTTNAPDYGGLIVLTVAWILVLLFVDPFHGLFFVNDLQISFPFAEHERVPVWLNFVCALFAPLAVLIVFNIVLRSPLVKHEATYLPLAISVIFTSLVTDILKNAVGRPRPDLLARCLPAPDTPPDVPVDASVCTADPSTHVFQEGWRSFPSGHSSFSFAGLGFTALFLAGQLGVFRPGTRDLGRFLLCLVPLVGATLIAISRCEDYRHDVYDVCTGSALGMAVAYWSYRRYWPRLSSPRCHEPYQLTEAASAGPDWQRVRDEEEAGADAGYEMATLPEDRR
ncbi:diacylglycerol pyrophosphate phosphatase-like protein [Hapsidospora chrysogenum ATCC 11550]|uniref:Diacylglycerol pyrophosphate phosphatase-like protein n=1 Tax=Hapsidospora chrysogenum (strain ATCC 11550 / CBS 779.69 / DSM 880 / IAM 14645 / JCM 23072 / IMI 49137) TaxID=857340 RepID=A0A086T3R4_HAPC1|nr:diacylglycerol pyrophosphate phosphatase-like protein [Hapsidospora chrysogenum ATCC 11550]